MINFIWIQGFLLYTRYVLSKPRSKRREALGRWLLHAARILPFPPGQTDDTPNEQLPQIIWMFWADGEANAPDLVRTCIQSWREMNPNWDVRVLDSVTAQNTVSINYVPANARIQLVADALRIELLRRYGGVWADATCLCTISLDTWLPPRMAPGFFAFSRPGWDRVLSNWFLASTSGNRLISSWSETARAYWKCGMYSSHIGPNDRIDQFIHHYLFDWMTHANPELADSWSAVLTLPARPSHQLQRFLKLAAKRPELRARAVKALGNQDIPVHKLNWRIKRGGVILNAAMRKAGTDYRSRSQA